jgi:uncharacterized protein YceH (UPF0502 family)
MEIFDPNPADFAANAAEDVKRELAELKEKIIELEKRIEELEYLHPKRRPTGYGNFDGK